MTPSSLFRFFRQARLGVVAFLCVALAACGGGTSAPAATPAPALTYLQPSASYVVGQAIVPNTPSAGFTRFSVNPGLPQGLSLDSGTGVISGTPASVSPASDYTVSASYGGAQNAQVVAVTLHIQVVASVLKPASLAYAQNPATYVASQPVTDTPSATGGQIAHYTVQPALPAGLSLDPGTGVISGTPTGQAPTATYTITGSNAAGSASVALSLTVNTAAAAVQPPTSLSYSGSPWIFTSGQAITPLSPTTSGGVITQYTVSPSLQAIGLALDPVTGVITGTPSSTSSPVTYTVTGSNSAGSASAQLQIGVQPVTVTLGGSVTGLPANESITVLLNGAATPFTIQGGSGTVPLSLGSVAQGSSYTVTLSSAWSAPTAATTYCYVTNGTGTASSNVSNIDVTCNNDAGPPATITLATDATVATQNGVSYAGWSLAYPTVVNGEVYYEVMYSGGTYTTTILPAGNGTGTVMQSAGYLAADINTLQTLFNGSITVPMGMTGDPATPQSATGNCTAACASNVTTLQTLSQGPVTVAIPTLAQLGAIYTAAGSTVPLGWKYDDFWSSTIDGAGAHYFEALYNGNTYSYFVSSDYFVAVQVP